MNKLAFLFFGSLTVGAAYFTLYDIGVQDANAYYHSASVRSGSAGNHTGNGGGK